MKLLSDLTLMDWSGLIGMLLGAVFAVISFIWGLGRGRMAERLLDTPAMKLRDAQIREETRIKVEEVERVNRMDHRHILDQMPNIAEHKAAIAVQPAIEKMIAVEHRQERMERAQETARVEHREDMNRVFTRLDTILDEVKGKRLC